MTELKKYGEHFSLLVIVPIDNLQKEVCNTIKQFKSLPCIYVTLNKPTYEIKSLKRKISKSKQEQKTVKAMQMEAEREYYKNRTISKDDFKKIIQQYKERMAKAQEIQKTSEEKLEKKLKKSKT